MKAFALALAALAPLAVACGAGSYVWVDDLAPEAAVPRSEYLIATGDLVAVRVLNQDALTTRTRVRADGRISLPILGDVEVRGKRPSSLRAELEARYKDYIVAPSVTINVEEFQPMSVSVLGEVEKPGIFPLEPGAHVAQALAVSGGPTEFAAKDRIFVLRNGARIRFTYEAVSRGEGRGATFALKEGDVVVVE